MRTISKFDWVGDWFEVINDNFQDLDGRSCTAYRLNNNYAEAATIFQDNSANWLALSAAVYNRKDDWMNMATAVHYTSAWWKGAITVVYPAAGIDVQINADIIKDWLDVSYPASDYGDGQVVYVNGLVLNNVTDIHDTTSTLEELSSATNDLYVTQAPLFCYYKENNAWVYSDLILPDYKDFPKYDCEPYGPFQGWPSRERCAQPLPRPLYLLKEIRCINGQTILADIPEYDQYVGQIVNISGSEYDYLLSRIYPAQSQSEITTTDVIIESVRVDNFKADDECHSCYDLSAIDCGDADSPPTTKFQYTAGAFATLNFTLTAYSEVSFFWVSDTTKTNIGSVSQPYGWVKTALNIDGVTRTEAVIFDDTNNAPKTGSLTVQLSAGDHTAIIVATDGLYSRVNNSRIDASWKSGACSTVTKRTHTNLGPFIGSEIRLVGSDLRWSVGQALNCICSEDVELDPTQCYRLTTLDKSKTVYASNDLSDFVGKQVYIDGYPEIWIVYTVDSAGPTEADATVYTDTEVGGLANLNFTLDEERVVTFYYGALVAGGALSAAEMAIKIDGREWNAPTLLYNERSGSPSPTNTGVFTKTLKKGSHNVQIIKKVGSPTIVESYVKAVLECYGSNIELQDNVNTLLTDSFTLLENKTVCIKFGVASKDLGSSEFEIEIDGSKYRAGHELAYLENELGDKDHSSTGVVYANLNEGTHDVSIIRKKGSGTVSGSWISVISKSADSEEIDSTYRSSSVASQNYSSVLFELTQSTVVGFAFGVVGSGIGLGLQQYAGLTGYTLAINGVPLVGGANTIYYYEDNNKNSPASTGFYFVRLDEGEYYAEVVAIDGNAGAAKSWVKAFTECSVNSTDCSYAVPRQVTLVSDCGAIIPTPYPRPSSNFILQSCDNSDDIYTTVSLSGYAGNVVKLVNDKCYSVSYVGSFPVSAVDNQSIVIKDAFNECCDCDPETCDPYILENCETSELLYSVTNLSAYVGQTIKLDTHECFTVSALSALPDDAILTEIDVASAYDNCVDCLSVIDIIPTYFLVKCDLSDQFYSEIPELSSYVSEAVYLTSAEVDPNGCYFVYEAEGTVDLTEFTIVTSFDNCVDCNTWATPVTYDYCCIDEYILPLGCNNDGVGQPCQDLEVTIRYYTGNPLGSYSLNNTFGPEIVAPQSFLITNAFCANVNMFILFEVGDVGGPVSDSIIITTQNTDFASIMGAWGVDAVINNGECITGSLTPSPGGTFSPLVSANPNPLMAVYTMTHCDTLSTITVGSDPYSAYDTQVVETAAGCWTVADFGYLSASEVSALPTPTILDVFDSCSACEGVVPITPSTVYEAALCETECHASYYQNTALSAYVGMVIKTNLNNFCYEVTPLTGAQPSPFPLLTLGTILGSYTTCAECTASIVSYVPPVMHAWKATQCENPSIIYYYTQLSNGVVGVAPDPAATFAGGTQLFDGNTFYGTDNKCYQVEYVNPYPCDIVPGSPAGPELYFAYPGGCTDCADDIAGVEVTP